MAVILLRTGDKHCGENVTAVVELQSSREIAFTRTKP